MPFFNLIRKPFQTLTAATLLASGCAQDTSPTVTEPAKAIPVVVDTNALHEAPIQIEDAPPPPSEDKVDSQIEAFFAEQTRNDQQHELNQLLKPLIHTVQTQEELLKAEIKFLREVVILNSSTFDPGFVLAARNHMKTNEKILRDMNPTAIAK